MLSRDLPQRLSHFLPKFCAINLDLFDHLIGMHFFRFSSLIMLTQPVYSLFFPSNLASLPTASPISYRRYRHSLLDWWTPSYHCHLSKLCAKILWFRSWWLLLACLKLGARPSPEFLCEFRCRCWTKSTALWINAARKWGNLLFWLKSSKQYSLVNVFL